MKKNHNRELGFKIPKNYFEESNNKLFDLSVNKKRNISNLKSLSEFIPYWYRIRFSEFIPYSIAAIFIIGFFVINSNQNIDNNNSSIEDSALLYSLISGEEITEEYVFDYLVTNTSSNKTNYKK